MAANLPSWIPPQRTTWQTLRRDPFFSVARWLHSCRPRFDDGASDVSEAARERLRLVCISDTHNTQPSVPYGDVLLHAGDLTNRGTFSEIQAQLDWLASLPHPRKIVIAGNHDRLLDDRFVAEHSALLSEDTGLTRADLNWHSITYLQNSSVTISLNAPSVTDNVELPPSFTSSPTLTERQQGKARPKTLKVFGSPVTPSCGAFAFQYPPIRDVWRHIVPADTDILLVHGPPKGYLDSVDAGLDGKGCSHLTREISRVRPRAVIFGHIHGGHGQEEIDWTRFEERAFSRLASMDEETIQLGRSGLDRWICLGLIGSGLVAAWIAAFVKMFVRRQWLESRKPKKTIIINAAIGSEGAGKGREPILVEI